MTDKPIPEFLQGKDNFVPLSNGKGKAFAQPPFLLIHIPNLWIRYVDDVFAIWPHGDQALNEFLTHLNSQHPAIQFTMEKEKDQKIAFLDVQIERTGASATTSVFRKKTHTNQYINYNSQ